MPEDKIIDACLAAGRALTAADKAAWHARKTLAPCRAQHRRELAEARTAASDALKAVRESLAAERGWRVSKRTFYLASLLRAGRDYDGLRFDRHLDCFRSAERPYRPIAAVSHSYATPAEVHEFAGRCGLAYEILPRSWSDPRHQAVLFMRKDLAP